jgi:hypothetical protein
MDGSGDKPGQSRYVHKLSAIGQAYRNKHKAADEAARWNRMYFARTMPHPVWEYAGPYYTSTPPFRKRQIEDDNSQFGSSSQSVDSHIGRSEAQIP